MNKFKVGDRVRYTPDTPYITAGTIVSVGDYSPNLPEEGTNYTVKWDGIDYNTYHPTIYKASDLTRLED